MVTAENVEGITITRNFSFFKNVPDFKTSTVAAKWYARETLPQRAESAQPSLLTMFWNYSELFYKDIFVTLFLIQLGLLLGMFIFFV